MIVHSLPDGAREFAQTRGYVHPQARGLLKTVAAVTGDTVCWSGEAVLVNGEPVAEVQSHDRMNRPLPSKQGCKVLSGQEILPLIMDKKTSFDGRYFGLINISQIQGCAEQIL